MEIKNAIMKIRLDAAPVTELQKTAESDHYGYSRHFPL